MNLQLYSKAGIHDAERIDKFELGSGSNSSAGYGMSNAPLRGRPVLLKSAWRSSSGRSGFNNL